MGFLSISILQKYHQEFTICTERSTRVHVVRMFFQVGFGRLFKSFLFVIIILLVLNKDPKMAFGCSTHQQLNKNEEEQI